MSTKTISIRRARPDDIGMLSAVFEAAWREAYQGVIPGVALQKFIAKRGPSAWRGMIGRGRCHDDGEIHRRQRDNADPDTGEDKLDHQISL